MSEPAPYLVDDADAPALREAVSAIGRAGYNEAAVLNRLGLFDLADLDWRLLHSYREERLASEKKFFLNHWLELFAESAHAPADRNPRHRRNGLREGPGVAVSSGRPADLFRSQLA